MKKVFFYLIMSTMLFTACSDDDNETSIVKKYSFNEYGKPVLINNPVENHTLQDFNTKVCGKGWKMAKERLIKKDGSVSEEPYTHKPEEIIFGGMGYKSFYTDKDSALVFFYNDGLGITVCNKVKSPSFDEKSGNLKDSTGKTIITIVSINADNTLTCIDSSRCPNDYGDCVELTYCQMEKGEWETLRDNWEHNQYIRQIVEYSGYSYK